MYAVILAADQEKPSQPVLIAPILQQRREDQVCPLCRGVGSGPSTPSRFGEGCRTCLAASATPLDEPEVEHLADSHLLVQLTKAYDSGSWVFCRRRS